MALSKRRRHKLIGVALVVGGVMLLLAFAYAWWDIAESADLGRAREELEEAGHMEAVSGNIKACERCYSQVVRH